MRREGAARDTGYPDNQWRAAHRELPSLGKYILFSALFYCEVSSISYPTPFVFKIVGLAATWELCHRWRVLPSNLPQHRFPFFLLLGPNQLITVAVAICKGIADAPLNFVGAVALPGMSLMEQISSPERQNHILKAMSDSDYAEIALDFKDQTLSFRQNLQAINRQVGAVYFLESGLASVVVIGGQRRHAEVALVGSKGFVGLPVVLGVDHSPYEIFMQVEGKGKCVNAKDLRAALAKSPTLLRHLLRYVHVFGVQTAYTALANAHGKLEERLARWLLMAHDRSIGQELMLTHEFLALMLGVRRAGVTIGLQHFEDKGIVATARGCIEIVDREGLEESANGLYGQPEAEWERLFCQ